MKTRFFLALAFVLSAGFAFSQKVEKSKQLLKEEVPVMVQQSFQKEFSNLPEKGTWRLMYTEDLSTQKLTPELYKYSCKSDGKWVEVFYKTDGTLDHTKGIKSATTQGSQP